MTTQKTPKQQDLDKTKTHLINTHAGHYIFKERLAKKKKLVVLINILSACIPAGAGFLFLSFESPPNAVKTIANIALLLVSIANIAIIVRNENEQIVKITKLISKQNQLILNLEEHRTYTFNTTDEKYSPSPLEILSQKVRTLMDETDEMSVTEEEKALGRRYSMIELNLKCEQCNHKPVQMTGIGCDYCAGETTKTQQKALTTNEPSETMNTNKNREEK
jgi:mobilome CxxCx(11)CxxC protein